MSVATAWSDFSLQERVMLGTKTSASRVSTGDDGSTIGTVGAITGAPIVGATAASDDGAVGATTGPSGAGGSLRSPLTRVGRSAPGSCIAASRRHSTEH